MSDETEIIIGEKSGLPRVNIFEGKGAHYDDWKERFSALMAIHKMHDILDVTKSRPTTSDAAKAAWDSMSNLVYARLILYTAGTAQGVVKKYRSTRDGAAAWRALIEKYEQKGEVKMATLHSELINAEMVPLEDPEAYFLKLEDLQLRLKELNVVVEDATLKGIVTAKLSDDYAPLRTVIDTMPNVTYDGLKDHVRNYYVRSIAARAAENEKNMAKAQALMAKSKNFGSPCYSCGERGHRMSECRSKYGGRDMKKCYVCDKIGHIARDCPSKKSAANVAETTVTF